MIKALFPGSFDPFTLGHLDVVKRAALISDSVIIGVAHNQSKVGKLDFDTRVKIIEQTLESEQLDAAVSVQPLQGLLVDAAKKLGATFLVKGIRNVQDLSYEEPMALMNQQLGQLETVFLLTKPEFAHISSSLVKEVYALGGGVEKLLPPAAIKALREEL